MRPTVEPCPRCGRAILPGTGLCAECCEFIRAAFVRASYPPERELRLFTPKVEERSVGRYGIYTCREPQGWETWFFPLLQNATTLALVLAAIVGMLYLIGWMHGVR